MDIDVVLTFGPPDVRALVTELHEAGVDGVGTVEGPHDVFIPLVQAAAVGGLDIASYVAIAFPRSPVHLAHTAWDLQSLSGGRFRLGLGTQVRAHVERRYGADFEHPVERMAEWVQAIRAVFDRWQDGTRLDFEGEFTSHTMMPPMLAPPPLPCGPPPILVGALGPRMVEMTTAVADGIVLHPMTSAGFLRTMVDGRIAAGLADAGRRRDDFEIVGGALVGIHTDDDADAVRNGLRSMVAFYGSTPAYRPVLDDLGMGDLQPRLQKMTRDGEWHRLTDLVDDDLVDHLTVCGTREQVADTLVERYRGLVDRLSLTFVQELPIEAIGSVTDALHAD
ncbi:TIGR03617 family F420-dependent LLM class oxidoreductase [Actinospongicola halichondriae]|uniref:TIGR03617 family F420-dependent LLM class oxidoreductase n=1 Tax=Actinospongicola halichondriae TaxID=3236844 RepID=UPI003D43D7DF